MSSGGVFTLITNDGKLDTILTGDKILKQRLFNVESDNRRNRMPDPTPTLLDIERTHIVFVNAHFKPHAAMATEYQKVKVGAGTATLNSTITFGLPQFGEFINDMVLHLRLSAPVLTQDAAVVVGTDEDYFRYHDYPGERLLKKIAFEVNGNPLDQYDRMSMVMHRKFCLGVNKRVGYDRMMGQEVPLKGYVNQLPAATQTYREQRFICNGLQTPTETKADGLEIFAPLMFWFRDPRIALPSVAIPQGQRYIHVDLAPATDFLSIVQRGANTNSVLSDPVVKFAELYVNNIFVTKEVHDIYIKRVGFNLIRVHREQKAVVSESEKEIQLTNMKWPIETLFVGMRMQANTNVADRWDKFTYITDTPFNAHMDAVTAQTHSKMIDKISITAHGIALYNEFPIELFNMYIPYHKGAYNLNTPEDPGVIAITFNLYPGSYQPSGYINASRARELFIHYWSSVIDTNNAAELTILGIAINFLLVADGTAILRYST